MCVPLWNNKEIIGIIYSDRISILEKFSDDDLRLLTLLSNLAAVKIENAKLIDQSIEKEKMAAKLNDFIHRSSPINSFITFFFCELYKKSGELKYINAGHNPPLILDKKGEIHRLESCGLCLGMFPSQVYEVKKVTLNPGDIAILFTDGITESRNKENKDFEEKGLIKFLRKHSKLSASKFLDKIHEELDSFTSGTDQMDDMTLVIIKRVTQ